MITLVYVHVCLSDVLLSTLVCCSCLSILVCSLVYKSALGARKLHDELWSLTLVSRAFHSESSSIFDTVNTSDTYRSSCSIVPFRYRTFLVHRPGNKATQKGLFFVSHSP